MIAAYSFTSPSKLILPSMIRTTRSASRAMELSWVIITMVFPSRLSFFKKSRTSRPVLESRAPVGCVKLVQNKEPQQGCCLPGFFIFILSCAVLVGVFSHLSTRTVLARTSGSFPAVPCSHQASSRTSDKIRPPALCLGSISQVCFLPSAFPPYLLYMIVTYFLANSQTAS